MYKPEGIVVKKTWRTPLEIVYQDKFDYFTCPANNAEDAKKEFCLAVNRITWDKE